MSAAGAVSAIRRPTRPGAAPGCVRFKDLAALLLVLLALLLAACGEKRDPLRVASNDFTEQRLLAEMLVLLAEEADVRAEHVVGYGDNRKQLEGIKRGIIDAYPEYSGSVLALAGAYARGDIPNSHALAREYIEPFGLDYLEPFGLDNGFALAVRRDFAIGRGIGTISELAALGEELDFATDAGSLARSFDGLYAMARRYGLKVSRLEVLPVNEREALFGLLASRAVDAAVVFQTDPGLQAYGVVVLEDDLNFFNDYLPAPLVRSAALQAHPALHDAWSALGGAIDTATMRRLNDKVERGGEDYQDVARAFLESLGLLPETSTGPDNRRSIVLAISPLADLGYLPIRAADAIRGAMPAMRLHVQAVPSPADAVRSGSARFGLVGAEEFFRIDEEGGVVRIDGIEAVGVVGNRLAHVIARRDAPPPGAWQRIGTGPEGAASWTMAGMVLHAMGRMDAVERVPLPDMDAVTQALQNGSIDAMALMVELQQAGLMNLLQSGDFQLVNVGRLSDASTALKYNFLHPARIPAGTYPGQNEVLDSVSAQVVLATRLPRDDDNVGESGPGIVPGIFTRLPQRLPFTTARQLDRLLGSPERVDPLIPASPGLDPPTPALRPLVNAEPASALLNVLAIAFLVAMGLLYFRKLPQHPELVSDVQSLKKAGQ